MTGPELADLRREAGLTQRQLGEAMGYRGDPGRTVRRLESRVTIGEKESLLAIHAIRSI